MTALTDEHLASLATSLEAEHDRRGTWTTPAGLYALLPLASDLIDEALATDRVPWLRIGEGSAYHLLEVSHIGDDVEALALLTHGWAFPPDDPGSWFGRPSQHPGRRRARTVTVVTRDGRRCSAIRLQGAAVVVDPGGEGQLMEALLGVWDRPGVAPPPAPVPARCRREARPAGG